jgi:DNA-binding NarL/FixJ family response regulator
MRVALADDTMIVREGLARLLAEAGCEVVATCATGPELLRAVADAHDAGDPRVDAAVVDIRMPPTYTDEGLTTARELRRRHPGLGVLVLSQHLESHYATELLEGAPEGLGYLLKDRVADIAVLVDALHRVVEGECVVDPTIVTRLLRRPRGRSPLDALSEREQEVLAVMAEGRSNGAIASVLGMGPKTVETHVRQILIKLDLGPSPDDHRRVLAVLRFLQADG